MKDGGNFLFDPGDIESRKLINILNSIIELCGIYEEASIILMCASCPVEIKTGCYKKI